jgi:hypothetical protein
MGCSLFNNRRPDVVRRLRVVAHHWRPLAGAAGLQVIVGIGLRLLPLPALRKTSRRLRRAANVLLPGAEDQVIWAIEATGRRLPGLSTCLVRALVGEMRLSSPERPLSLVIGVKRTLSGGLLSHAWLRDRERVLIGGPIDDSLSPIVQWDSAA